MILPLRNRLAIGIVAVCCGFLLLQIASAGTILKASCPCGYRLNNIYAGGVFANFRTVCAASGLLLGFAERAVPKTGYIVYVGTYTRQQDSGIYAFRFDPASGKAISIGLVAEAANPSFLAIHPNGRFLYAVNEVSTFAGRNSGSVTAYAVDPLTGRLNLLNTVSSQGASPCHLTVDRSGRFLFVANYGGGSVAVLPVKKDGSLGAASGFVQHEGSSVNSRRQQGPHAHEIVLSPDNRFALVPDLGLDQVRVYRTNLEAGTLVLNTPGICRLEPGSGPRHLAFHPDGRFAYVINELRSTVTVFAYDPKNGILRELQTAPTLPNDFTGTNACAEIAVHRSGRFLYGSNRGHDTIAVYGIDPGKGTLTSMGQVATQGKNPRSFAIDPTGNYLLAANQDTGNVVLFRIDRQTGRLAPTGDVLEVPLPACVTFLEAR